MAARKPRFLSPDEIVQLLQDLSENESDIEEHNVDEDMDYVPPQISEANNSSSDSEEIMDEQASDQNIQTVGISSANISPSVPVPSTSTETDPSAHVSTQTTWNSVDLQTLSRDFSAILKDKTFSDVKLKCAGCTFSANRSVLAARSEVFAAMFRNKMAETETGEVDINDTDPEVLELLLKYVYSAEIPHLCEETAHRLYEAADKYAVHGLRRACSDWMVKCQTTDNCLDLLLLGDKHSDENLKEAVACFVAEHLPDLSAESWSTFRKNYPLLVLSVLEKRCADSMPGSAKEQNN